MESSTKNIFFVGKGGVGKSTASALTALRLAAGGHKTLLVSLDPAHNQSDIFKKKLSEKNYKINEYLFVKEVNVDKWVKKYLDDIQFQVKRTYSYLTAFNLENYLDIIQYSPGIEEYGLLMAYKSIREKAKRTDYIIFDMPPTALSLKFLALPRISLLWLNKLIDLRNQIIEKRKIISKVKFGKKEIDRDKIRNKLNHQIKEYQKIRTIFEDINVTTLNLVLNTDKLSFSESELIVKKLSEFNISIKNIFLNKWTEDFDTSGIQNKYANCGFQKLPISDTPLLGIDVLNNYLKQISSFIEF